MNIEELLTRRELAGKLKFTARHVANLEHLGLPRIKLGSSVRYHWPDVVAFLEANRAPRIAVVVTTKAAMITKKKGG